MSGPCLCRSGTTDKQNGNSYRKTTYHMLCLDFGGQFYTWEI